jgi:hypothetical protein
MRLAQAAAPPQYVQPPQTRTSGEEQRTPGSSRGLGVHNILNPSEPDPSGSSTPQFSGGITQSPQSTISTSQYGTVPSYFPSQTYPSQQPVSSSPPTEGQGETTGRGRKVLIPKSPRSVSLGGRAAATIDAQQAPFISSREGRMYTAEPGPGPSSEVPPMPQLPGPSHYHYNIPHSAPTPSLARHASMAVISATTRAPVSESASPSPSLKSQYSGPSHPSPIMRYSLGQPPQSASYFPGSSFGAPQQGEEASQARPPGTEGPYMTSLPESIFQHGAPGGGQNPNIRFMPITTEHGRMYVPVDVQAASKMADEKRARNAGASARFRERRKQKEKEASMNIQKLEQQMRDLERRVRDAESDRDFYRGERDRFRDVCFRNPATRDLAMQAPMSPRLNRTTAFPPPPASTVYQTSEGSTPQEQERPARRRRTDEYTFNAPASTLPPYQGPIYGTGPGPGPGGHGPTMPQPPSTSLPPLRMSTMTVPPPGGVSAPQPATTRPPSFEQYPRSGYERGWPGDGSGSR